MTGMRENDKTIAQIRDDSPFPWVVHEHGKGLLGVYDATGREVPLFRVLAFVVKVSAAIAAQAPPPRPAP